MSSQLLQFDRTTMVTATVARQLDRNGHIPTPQSAIPGAITASRAVELAEAYIRLFGPVARPSLEKVRGDAIDFAALRAQKEVVLSESQFEPLDQHALPADRNHVGPYYIVTLEDNGGAVLTVAVSALASDLTVDSTGVRSAAPTRGNEFLVWPFPLSGPATPALSAQHAMAAAFRTFGEQIDALPVYERKGTDFYPQEGAWRLVLAKPIDVRLRDNSLIRQTKVLYVVNPGTFAIPVSASGESLRQQTLLRSAAGSDMALQYRSGAAQALAEVRPTTSR